MQKEIINIRPHHLLCINFFIGKGYSDTFITNFKKQKEYLEKNNPYINLDMSSDIFCNSCPNKINGCTFINKVNKYDLTILNLVSHEGKYLNIKKEIINLLKITDINTICGDCQFINICRSIQLKKYLKEN